jgi:hypothetical protein
MSQQRPGYVRCGLSFPLKGFQILQNPEMPTARLLTVLTDDGAIGLLVNREIATTIGEALLRAAAPTLLPGLSRRKTAQGLSRDTQGPQSGYRVRHLARMTEITHLKPHRDRTRWPLSDAPMLAQCAVRKATTGPNSAAVIRLRIATTIRRNPDDPILHSRFRWHCAFRQP